LDRHFEVADVAEPGAVACNAPDYNRTLDGFLTAEVQAELGLLDFPHEQCIVDRLGDQ